MVLEEKHIGEYHYYACEVVAAGRKGEGVTEFKPPSKTLFTENDTNNEKLYGFGAHLVRPFVNTDVGWVSCAWEQMGVTQCHATCEGCVPPIHGGVRSVRFGWTVLGHG